jgi:hypothetical protein
MLLYENKKIDTIEPDEAGGDRGGDENGNELEELEVAGGNRRTRLMGTVFGLAIPESIFNLTC